MPTALSLGYFVRTQALMNLFISMILITLTPFALAQQSPQMPINGLKGVGINSLALWSANSNTYEGRSLADHIRPISEMGFSHVIVIACADWILPDGKCKRLFQNKENIIDSIKYLTNETNLHVVLALKPYQTQTERGRKRSRLQKALETSKQTRKDFVQSWVDIAQGLKDVPREALSFSILNEPEFEFPNPTSKKRQAWERIAKTTISAIREVSPDRVIIYEGIAKTSAFKRFKDGRGGKKYKGVSSIIRPLPFKDIVYGVHYYQPHWFVQQHKNFARGPYGRRYDKRVRNMVARDAKELVRWANRNGVPTMLSEVGCVSYLDGKSQGPRTRDGCPNYARDVVAEFGGRGISISWFGFEKEKTVFERGPADRDIWLPLFPKPDNKLLNALGLEQQNSN